LLDECCLKIFFLMLLIERDKLFYIELESHPIDNTQQPV